MEKYFKAQDVCKAFADYIWSPLPRTVSYASSFVEKIPAADVVEVVRCKDCKHRIVNEHFGEKGYMKLKAMCKLDTGDPFELGKSAEDDNWFCADGERKDGEGTNHDGT